jgi:uncharacterized protein (DUF58 family)
VTDAIDPVAALVIWSVGLIVGLLVGAVTADATRQRHSERALTLGRPGVHASGQWLHMNFRVPRRISIETGESMVLSKSIEPPVLTLYVPAGDREFEIRVEGTSDVLTTVTERGNA